jgi:glycosyl hydrolase family 26
MKKKTASPRTVLRAALASVALCSGVLLAISAPATASSPVSNTLSAGLIIGGTSRNQCLAPNVVGSGPNALQAAITKFDGLTGTSVSCISTYLNGAPTWSTWEHPWITQSQFGYTTWVAAAPQTRQLVLQVDLIPDSLKNSKNPIGWERSCAAGAFDAHATQLGDSLVAAGLQRSVIRLGAEMNGPWEADYVGTTPSEQRLWVRCFDNEVTGLRGASGEHFLFDWNPNACTTNIPFSQLYPGDSFVNIIGLDFFDVSCVTPQTALSFAHLSEEPAGLSIFEAFAKAHRKPMSFPEWGLTKQPSGDDPEYIDGIGSTFDSRAFAFETYFDGKGTRNQLLPLGPKTPLSLAAFRRWFGTSS